MKRAALYVRVSTEEQKLSGHSVDSQVDALKQYCLDNNYKIVDIYSDAGISAHIKYTRRPALLRMIEDCQSGKVDIILVTKLDRFFRSVKDYYAVMDRIGKVPWRAIWEDYETETSSGIFKVNIMLSVAQAESDRTAERVKAVNEYRRQSGQLVCGKAPVGYKIENKQLVKDEATQEAVAAFWDAYIKTYSQVKAINAAAEHGLSITKLRARRMAKNEVYCGNAYGCVCEPYISISEFRNINNYSLTHFVRSDGKATRVYLFAGIVRCAECGSALGSHFVKGRYKTYRCTGHDNAGKCSSNRTTYESKIEKYLLDNLTQILDDYNVQIKSHSKSKKIDDKIVRLKAKLSRIGDRYENDEISREEYLSKSNAIKEEIQSLSNDIIPLKVYNFPSNWESAYSELSDEGKRTFWRKSIKQILVDSEGNIAVKL